MQAQRLLPLCCSVYMATVIGVLLQVVATHKQDSLVLLLGERAGSWGLHIRAHLHTLVHGLHLLRAGKYSRLYPPRAQCGVLAVPPYYRQQGRQRRAGGAARPHPVFGGWSRGGAGAVLVSPLLVGLLLK